MKLTILGGGGFRVPLMFRTLLNDRSEHPVTQLRLWDTDTSRLTVMANILAAMAQQYPTAPSVMIAENMEQAILGSDFVFSAIRVGGTAGRAAEERIASCCGVLGQETTGFGGLDYALRGIPTAVAIAQSIAKLAPQAYLINFTNPAGIITQVSSRILGDRVIGICDSPVGLARRILGVLARDGLISGDAAAAMSAVDGRVQLDYVGLNHLGWLQRLLVDGVDVLPQLLARADLIDNFEEGRLFGVEWLSLLGSVPNEYLHYYYYAREARQADTQVEATRGVFLAEQQMRFYQQAATASGAQAYALWEATRLQREETYMASNRLAAGGAARDQEDLEAGGYDRVALAVMKALAFNQPANLIINTVNRGRIRSLADEDVIEGPCRVDASGVTALPVSPLPAHAVGLVNSVKYAENTVIEAALTGRRELALKAFAHHPLIDGVGVARRLLDAACEEFPELGYLR